MTEKIKNMRKEEYGFNAVVLHMISMLMILMGVSVAMAVFNKTWEGVAKDTNTSDIILLCVLLVLLIGGIVSGMSHGIIIGVSIWLSTIYIVELVFR